jgi:CzcA family heavy metal efflux pump
MIQAALRHPHAVLVGILATILLGVTVALRLPADLLPPFRTPAVQIVTFYPGMPAEVMEKDITSRLERWTGQANGIARQEAKSIVGVSVVRDYFREDVDPNTAMAQVATLAAADLFYLPPGTAPPMVMPFDPTATTPLCLLSVSSASLDETALYDIAYFDLRNRLQGISGVIAPAVYGGKLRRVLAHVDPEQLHARDLSLLDVQRGLKATNVFLPTGNVAIGNVDYQVVANAMPERVRELNEHPIAAGHDGRPILMRDVGDVEDTSAIQTNVVRVDGRRQVYIPIYRQPGANTIEVVSEVRRNKDAILSRLPPGIELDVVFDQSVYVREAIAAVSLECAAGAVLAALAVLLFLRSWRATWIAALAIPLSLLAALLGLFATNQTLNLMTLGGFALAIGRLVDDSIVVVENTHRHLTAGKPAWRAALDAAREVAMPVLAATVTTIIVFLPIVFLTGMGRYLFTPLALAITFAMAASYVVALTVVPVVAGAVMRAPRGAGGSASDPHPDARRGAYGRLLAFALRWPLLVVLAAAMTIVAAGWLARGIGRELFPVGNANQFTILLRAPSGTRLEHTEQIVARAEQHLRQTLGADLRRIIANIGVLNDWPAAYTPNSGPMDAFLLVQLRDDPAAGAADWAARLRTSLAAAVPGAELAFDTGGAITAALNGGLPSPIDVQIQGNSLSVARDLALAAVERIRAVPGTADVRIQQKLDYPQLRIDIDRDQVAACGLTPQDVFENVTAALSSSVAFDPAFWIDPGNGNHYFLGVQYRQEAIASFDTILDVPITSSKQARAVPLRAVARQHRGTAPAEIHHRDINRVTDVMVNVVGRDVGSVAADIERALATLAVPSGYRITLRGEIQSLRESFGELAFGLLLAAALVYLVLVLQFRSFLDPLVILAAVPLGAIGVVLALRLTGTHFSVPAFLGLVFMIGIAVSNSILLVEFMNRLRRQGVPFADAIAMGARIRLRPVLMTSFAAIAGLMPMAIARTPGAEANAPLARAVIGGLLASTLLTLVVVPVLYQLLCRRPLREAAADREPA